MGLLENFTDGQILGLVRLFGGETTPRRPGEPTTSGARQVGGDLASFINSDKENALGRRSGALYPNMQRDDLIDILDDMDRTGLGNSVVDMMTDDAVVPNPDTGRVIDVEAPGAFMREISHLFGTLAIEEKLPELTRLMNKYGDNYRRMIYSAGEGVTHLVPTPVRRMEPIIERETGELQGYKEKGRTFRDQKNEVSWPWDYLDFRLPSNNELDAYGVGVLTPGIRSWTMITMAEDFALLYRISRHPDRLLFNIDVGTAPEDDAIELVQDMKRRMVRKNFPDPVSMLLRQEYNPMTMLENLFVGKRPNSETDIKLLQGSSNVQDVTDLNYFLKKFLLEVGIPPAMFSTADVASGGEEAIQRNRRLVNQDIRYARKIKKIQKAVCNALYRLVEIHLSLKMSGRAALSENVVVAPWMRLNEGRGLPWIDPQTGEKLIKISLQPPSFLEELERLEVMQLRDQIASDRLMMMEAARGTLRPFEWTQAVLRDVLQFREEEIEAFIQEPPPSPEELQVMQTGAALHQAAQPPPKALPPGRSKSASKTKPKGKSKSKPKAKKKSESLLYKGFGYTNGGFLKDRDREQLNEMILRNPGVRRAIQRLRDLREG